MTGRRRAGLLAAAGLVTMTGLTGCVPFACPAIGWSNTLTVQLDGDTAAVDHLQLCTDAGCAPADDMEPTGPLALIRVIDHDGTTWTFSVEGLPETFTVRTLIVDDTVLSGTEVTPEWVRVGGSAQCGGPSEATVAVQP